MSPCDAFRRSLEAALTETSDAGSPAGRLTELGWHEHLLACTDCRALLEQEEALELLLESLPEPRLPPELADRVLARLRAGADLDQLLDLDRVEVPGELAERVRGGLRRERRLDELLDAAGRVDVPSGLAGRLRAGLAAERAAPAGPRPVRGLAIAALARWRAAAAAGLLLAAGLWWAGRGAEPARIDVASLDTTLSPEDEAVVAWLPALEYWEELRELDPLEAEIVTHLDEVDEALLEEGS